MADLRKALDWNPETARCGIEMSVLVAGDGGYENPDGARVQAPAGTVVAEMVLHPSPRSRIRVETALPPPDRWDGRLVGIGNGGAGGKLPSGGDVFAMHLRRGRAATTTDLGTAPDPLRAGIGNPEAWKDFGHRATHLAMVAGRVLAAAHYGRAPRFAYFHGGSTGGQQGLSLAQRHPDDCDAVLAAVPAHARTALHAYFLWNWQALHHPDGSLLFTQAQERSWREAVLEAFAPGEKLERAKWRFVSDPRWTPALLEESIRLAAARDRSLGPEHFAALRRVSAGPAVDAGGRRVHGGIPPAAPLAPSYGNLWIFTWAFGESFSPATFDFQAGFGKYETLLAPDLDAESADLDAFRARGGKLLVYSGTADSCVPWSATAAWYRRVAARYGAEAAAGFCRYYLLPGREHFGGPGVQTVRDEFSLLVRWREKGLLPRPVGHGMVPPAFDLPLPPFAP